MQQQRRRGGKMQKKKKGQETTSFLWVLLLGVAWFKWESEKMKWLEANAAPMHTLPERPPRRDGETGRLHLSPA